MTLLSFRKIRWSGLGKIIVLCLFVSGVLIAVDQLSMRAGLDGSQRVVDDLVGGLIAGTVVYLHERRRRRQLNEKDRIHELANHHIRNALQLLTLVQYEPEKATQMEIVDSCVRRIDWTLREVLPGKSKAAFWDASEPSGKEPKWSLGRHTARGIREAQGTL